MMQNHMFNFQAPGQGGLGMAMPRMQPQPFSNPMMPQRPPMMGNHAVSRFENSGGLPGLLQMADQRMMHSQPWLRDRQRAYARGGQVDQQLDPQQTQAVLEAVKHLQAGDKETALQLLTQSGAVAHPGVQMALRGLMGDQ